MLCSLFFIFIGITSTYAYDDKLTHPTLTTKATYSSQLDDYLKHNLGNQFQGGIQSLVNGTQILELLTKGSTAEDHPPCQAANHFHNPHLPWDSSQMSDDANPLETPLAFAIREGCAIAGWNAMYRKSNVTWATGYMDTLGTLLLTLQNA